jgi:hypothetical protein
MGIRGAADYLVRHRRAVALDLLVVIAWVVGLRWLFQTQGFDNWLYYVVLFGGVVAYVTTVPNWYAKRSSENVGD